MRTRRKSRTRRNRPTALPQSSRLWRGGATRPDGGEGVGRAAEGRGTLRVSDRGRADAAEVRGFQVPHFFGFSFKSSYLVYYQVLVNV